MAEPKHWDGRTDTIRSWSLQAQKLRLHSLTGLLIDAADEIDWLRETKADLLKVMKTIKQWAAHECVGRTTLSIPCSVEDMKWHAERRELAQQVLKAEAARDKREGRSDDSRHA